MKEKYYLDTAIWVDYYENRRDKFRPLGEWAFELFKKIRKNKEKVLYSDLVVNELSMAYDKETINKIFEIASEMLEKVEIRKEQRREAKKVAKERKIPRGDVLHAILAKDNNAILVSRDKHFQLLRDIYEFVKPEDII